MSSKSIGDAVREQADRDLHADYIEYACNLIEDSNNHAPRIDTGERFIGIEDRLDEYRADYFSETGIWLRRITIQYSAGKGWYARLEPLPPLQSANHGNTGDNNENRTADCRRDQ